MILDSLKKHKWEFIILRKSISVKNE